MRNYIIYPFMVFLFIQCKPSQDNIENAEELTRKSDTSELSSGAKDLERTEEVISPKSYIDQFTVGEVVDAKYSDFNLGEYSKDDMEAYFVKAILPINPFHLMVFVKGEPCNPILCPEELAFFLLNDENILHHFQTGFNREGSPEVEIIDDTFIQYIETRHEWYENEAGAMEYDKEGDHIEGIRLVIENNQLIPLSELPKDRLRIYRNLIFAKHGYIFQSDDLKKYFNNQEWYRPLENVNPDEVISAEEKELVGYIRGLEEGL